jgi:hypothetical protein
MDWNAAERVTSALNKFKRDDLIALLCVALIHHGLITVEQLEEAAATLDANH